MTSLIGSREQKVLVRGSGTSGASDFNQLLCEWQDPTRGWLWLNLHDSYVEEPPARRMFILQRDPGSNFSIVPGGFNLEPTFQGWLLAKTVKTGNLFMALTHTANHDVLIARTIEQAEDTSTSTLEQMGGTTASTIWDLEEINPKQASRIKELAALESNWDHLGAIQPTTTAVNRAVRLLLHAVKIAAPATFIAPLYDGGLQLEWGPISKRKFVVAIDPDGKHLEFVYIDERGATEATEGELHSDSELNQYLPLHQ